MEGPPLPYPVEAETPGKTEHASTIPGRQAGRHGTKNRDVPANIALVPPGGVPGSIAGPGVLFEFGFPFLAEGGDAFLDIVREEQKGKGVGRIAHFVAAEASVEERLCHGNRVARFAG